MNWLSFFTLGTTTLVSQALIIRELLFSFYGNEIFAGLVLAFWLLWVALGSFYLPGFFLNKNSLKTLTACLVLIPLILLCQIVFIRFLAGQGEFPGLMPDLFSGLIAVFFIPAPLCLILGLQFTIACRFLPTASAGLVSKAYLIETLGFIFGGVFFSYFLVNFNPWQVLWLIALLNLVTALWILRFLPGKNLKIFVVIGLALVLLLVPFLSAIDLATISLRFPKQKLLESLNSPFGNLTVTKIGQQYNFYESGLLLSVVTEPELLNQRASYLEEEISHLSLLEHSQPEKVLLIGRGRPKLVEEILKHPIKELYYLELDAKLIDIFQKYLPLENDQRLKTLALDGRYFLKTTSEKFDVIIINLPLPSTLLLNRFYTQEFFKEAKQKLNPGGLLAFSLKFSPDGANPHLKNLNASILKTLKAVFPFTLLLPGENNLFLASSQNVFLTDANLIIQRFGQRNLQNAFVTENYLVYRLDNQKIAKAANDLGQNKEAKINRDSQPTSLFYSALFWLAAFYPALAGTIRAFGPILPWLIWITFISLMVFGVAFLRKSKNQKTAWPIISMLAAGFGLMAQELIIIFSFQTIVGYLYLKIALIFAAVMLGLALGTIAGRKGFNLSNIHFFSAISFLATILVLKTLSFVNLPLWQTESIFLFLAIIAGFFPGLIFPVANKLYLENQLEPNKKISVIYSADLLGSFLGALLSGIVFIPLLGIPQTLILLSLLNLSLFVIVSINSRS